MSWLVKTLVMCKLFARKELSYVLCKQEVTVASQAVTQLPKITVLGGQQYIKLNC